MLSVWASIYFILLAASAVTPLDTADDGLLEWEKLVDRTVRELRMKRRVPEPEDSIVSLQEHYNDAFLKLNDYHHAAIQQYGYEGVRGDTQTPVSGRYIVMLHDGVSDQYLDHTVRILENADMNSDGRLVARHIKPFRTVGKGFTATLGNTMLALLTEHPERFVIEQDMALKRHDQEGMIEQAEKFKLPWNLDRLDQHSNFLDGKYNPIATGEGVDVYILDTGIRYSHVDFEGRAKYAGYDAIDDLLGTNYKGADCNSHGTHCAGTVGGKKYGVAKKVNLYAARVLDCSGSGAVSGIMHTMEYIVNERKKEKKENGAVFSMSLGVEKSESFNMAANAASKEGVVVVSASGNQGKDSCDYSPGSAEQAISVAASDVTDNAAMFSNLGKCVTVFAPGARITSASNSCDNCIMSKSGTSMACPHAAGIAAMILSMNPLLTPQQVKQKIMHDATKNVIQMSEYTMTSAGIQDSTPNLLLYAQRASI